MPYFHSLFIIKKICVADLPFFGWLFSIFPKVVHSDAMNWQWSDNRFA